MEYRVFGDKIVARIDKGEEIIESIKKICIKEKTALGKVSALGAVNRAKIGLFETGIKKYHSAELSGDFEITSLSGTITEMDGEPYLHIHINLAGADHKTFGGHLNEAYVSATCELVIDVINGRVGRKFSKEIGLNLMEF
ncbi:MAG TPA: DNA-binding protein [Clostridiales bacterium]|nr:DNA-binding protein [Clostridiales bacterium]